MFEYKFRVFHDGKMHKVHSLHLGSGKVMVSTDYPGNRSLKLSECILMQWTGFVDKNGEDIYEGDILDCKHSAISPYEHEQTNLRVVKRCIYNNGLMLTTPDSDFVASGYGLNIQTQKRFTIVGNIHVR